MAVHRVFLVVVIVGTFLAFGGMPAWTTLPILGASLLLWMSATIRHRTRGFTKTPLDLAFVAVAGAVALQVVPLPAMIVDAVSPRADDLRTQLLFGVDAMRGGWRPLTLDVSRTLASLATVVSAVLVFVASRSILETGSTRALCRTLAIFGALAGVIALALRVAAPDVIYGFWRPDAIAAKPLGPFVNRNHFAGWLLLILPLSAGYFVAQMSARLDHGRFGSGLSVALRSRATTTGTAAFLMLIVLLLTGSRSAWVGLAVSASAGWWLSRRRGVPAAAVRNGTMALGVVAVLLALLLVNPDRIFARLAASLEELPTGRLSIWRETLPLISDFWGTGTGAGTFAMAMVAYQQTWAYFSHLREFMHFNQAHNHYLHVAAEGGVLIVVPMLAAIALSARSLARALRDDGGETYWIRLGAGASLLAIAVQSAFEIPLIAPANAVLAAVVLAIGVHRRVPSHGGVTMQ